MAYTLNDYFLFVGTLAFISLILWDVRVACQKGHSFPRNALVVCGLILQLVANRDVQNVSISGQQKEQVLASSIRNQILIDASRLTLCVFMGNLLPCMANTSNWFYIAAALVSISIHVVTEFSISILFYATDFSAEANQVISNQIGRWYIASGPALIAVMLVFAILLFWGVSYSRFVGDSFSSRIPVVLSPLQNEGRSWDIFKDKILKTWVVSRVCQPEYALMRSPISAGVAFIVTFYVVYFGVRVLFLRNLLNDRLPLFVFQCVFILIGWIVILCRLFVTLFRFEIFPKTLQTYDPTLTLSKRFDLLHRGVSFVATRHLNVTFRILPLLTPTIINKPCSILSAFMFLILGTLCAFSLRVICFLSILCWIVFSLILASTCKIFKQQLSEDEKEDIVKYMAEELHMPFEHPESLWIDNRTSFYGVKTSLEESYKHGQKFAELIEVLKEETGEYLALLEGLQSGIVKKFLTSLNEPLWRMIALVLLEIIIEVDIITLSGVENVSNNYHIKDRAVKAYEQAEKMLKFRDCPDNVDISFEVLGTSNVEDFRLTQAADAKKEELDLKISQTQKEKQKNPVENELKTILDYIKKLCDEAEKTLISAKLLQDVKSAQDVELAEEVRSLEIKSANESHRADGEGANSFDARCADWRVVGLHYCRYKVCKIILNQKYENIGDLREKLLIFLADVMGGCISGLPDLVLKSCREWAEQFKEEKIRQAIQIAGLVFGVLNARISQGVSLEERIRQRAEMLQQQEDEETRQQAKSLRQQIPTIGRLALRNKPSTSTDEMESLLADYISLMER